MKNVETTVKSKRRSFDGRDNLSAFLRMAELWFFSCVSVLLFITAAAKLISALNMDLPRPSDAHQKVLHQPVLATIGTIELAFSAFLMLAHGNLLKRWLVIGFATGLFVYRIGSRLVGDSDVCNCIGYFSKVLPIAPSGVNAILHAIIGFMLIGGCGFLTCDLILHRKRSKNE